jgi:hypothetical protein
MTRRLGRWWCAPGALLVVVLTLFAGAATPALAADGVLGTSHAVLAPAGTPITRTLSPVQGCQTLLDTGEGDCTVVRTAHGDLVVTVEPGPALDDVLVTRPWIVRVYRPDPRVTDGWQVALETRRERWGDGWQPGPLYAGVTAKAVDVTGDARQELVVGYRSEGTGMILDVDVVDTTRHGAPRLLAHEQLYKGSVVFRHGALVTFAPVYKRSDANCCPTWIERDVLGFRDGRLHVDAGPRVPSRRVDVPPSELA